MASFGSPAAFLESQSAARINHQAQHKQDLSDTELETNIGQANSNIDALQQKLGTLDPSSRDHAETMQALQQQLAARTQLFHPANNPGAIQKFGHLLGLGRKPAAPVAPPTISTTPSIQMASANAPAATPALPATPVDRNVIPMNRGQATPAVASAPIPALGDNTLSLPEGPARTVQGPQTPAALKAQAQANLIAAGIPAPPPGQLSPDEAHKAALVHARLEPPAAPDKPAAPVAKSSLVAGKDDDGQPVMGYIEGGKFVPVPGTTPPAAKAPPQSSAALQTYIRLKYGPNPTAAQYEQGVERFKRLGTPDTNGVRETIVYDANGDPHIELLHTASHKTFGGGGGGNPGSGSKGTGGGPAEGRPLAGHRNTPAQTSAAKDFVGAVKLSSFADQVLASPTPQAQKQLALKLIKESAGRVNMQEFDIMTKRAGIANTLEAWANNVTSGALPDEIFRNLVDAAHKNLAAAKVARDEAYKPMDSSPGKMKDKANPAGGKSLADRLNDALGGK